MKIMSLLMSFFILCSASASTVGERNLSQAIQELNYALTVEWDQKDPNFYNQQIAGFRSQVDDLTKSGIGPSEQIQILLKDMKDTKLKTEISKTLKLIKVNQLSHAEAQKLIRDIGEKSKARGASWSGDLELRVGIAILIVLAILVVDMVTRSDSDSDSNTNPDNGTNPGPFYSCGYRNTCFGSWGPGTDDYGYRVGTGTCGYQYVCGWYNN